MHRYGLSVALAIGLTGCHLVAQYKADDAGAGADDAGADARRAVVVPSVVVPSAAGAATSKPLPAGALCNVIRFANNVNALVGSYSCVALDVSAPGHYAFYADMLADSCDYQLAESGYLLISNSCNPEGLPLESDGEPLFIADDDNVPCDPDREGVDCPTGSRCVERPGEGACCMASAPQFFGTFWLEPTNELCLFHTCDYPPTPHSSQFVDYDECGDSNSIVLRIDFERLNTAFSCARPELPACR